MSSRHRRDGRVRVPGWFPFALVASGLVALGAGIRSGFRLGGSETKTPPPPPVPPISQARFP